MIKACFIIKYPPIQGGVSRHGYWLAREMAERGNQIFVVTNANEVEDDYRIHLDDDDREWYEFGFEASGGFVKVRNTQPANKNLVHIPYTNPYVTKLASIATQVIRRHDCQVILSYYLQPYGLAAYLASQWTGVPYVVRHAGSDLGRLMKHRDLTTAYREVLKAADCVWTGLSDINTFLAMGVKEENIWRRETSLVPQIFSPQTSPLDLNRLLEKLASVRTQHVENVLINRNSIDLSKPTIGIYGKVGEVKGSFDLVTALGQLKQEGLDFNFVALTQGRDFRTFRDAIAEHDLDDRTWTIPFIAHWRVPGFIRTCTAVCFLERDFPISFHGPGIPKEILACGTCLILSGEIAAKQRILREKFIDGENVLLVDDPKEHDDLKEKLRFVIKNPEKANNIGLKGRRLLEHKADSQWEPGARIEALEQQLNRVIERRKVRGVRAEVEITSSVSPRKEQLRSCLCHTSSLLDGKWESLVELFCRESTGVAESQFNDAVNLCEFLETQLSGLCDENGYVEDVLRYEKHCNLLYADFRGKRGTRPDSLRAPVTPFSESPGGDQSVRKLVPVQRKNARGLRKLTPVRAKGISIEPFSYDMQELTNRIARGEDPSGLHREQTFILFKKELNFVGLKLELSEGSKRLLDFCDGKYTVEKIVDEFSKATNGAQSSGSENLLEAEVLATLKDFATRGVIVWCEEK